MSLSRLLFQEAWLKVLSGLFNESTRPYELVPMPCCRWTGPCVVLLVNINTTIVKTISLSVMKCFKKNYRPRNNPSNTTTLPPSLSESRILPGLVFVLSLLLIPQFSWFLSAHGGLILCLFLPSPFDGWFWTAWPAFGPDSSLKSQFCYCFRAQIGMFTPPSKEGYRGCAQCNWNLVTAEVLYVQVLTWHMNHA